MNQNVGNRTFSNSSTDGFMRVLDHDPLGEDTLKSYLNISKNKLSVI